MLEKKYRHLPFYKVWWHAEQRLTAKKLEKGREALWKLIQYIYACGFLPFVCLQLTLKWMKRLGLHEAREGFWTAKKKHHPTAVLTDSLEQLEHDLPKTSTYCCFN